LTFSKCRAVFALKRRCGFSLSNTIISVSFWGRQGQQRKDLGSFLPDLWSIGRYSFAFLSESEFRVAALLGLDYCFN